MIEGIDISQRIEYTCKTDVSDPKTIFVLRPLTGLERMKLTEGSSSTMSIQKAEEVLKYGLVETRNYEYVDVINTLPPEIISELIVEILRVSNLTDEDKKK